MTRGVQAPTGRWEARLGERGNASVLVAAVMGVVVTLCCAAMLVAAYATGYHRARAAADLAAVSGAAAFQLGQDACRQARRSAADNGARSVSCETVGDQLQFVVSVRVAVPIQTRVRGLPTSIEAAAHAASVG